MSEKRVAWIHADNLNPHQPALTKYGDLPAIFVWDEALLNEWQISFKRIVFIYECLLELPVVIRKGDVAEEVAKFAHEHDADRIITPASPSPRHHLICQQIARQMPEDAKLSVVRGDEFVDYDGHIDLKRFSRYWKHVKKMALSPTRK